MLMWEDLEELEKMPQRKINISDYQIEGMEIKSHCLEKQFPRAVTYCGDGFEFAIATDSIGTQICYNGRFFGGFGFVDIEQAIEYVRQNRNDAIEWAKSVYRKERSK